MKAETVQSPLGLKFRIPLNHENCKQSVLHPLSITLFTPPVSTETSESEE